MTITLPQTNTTDRHKTLARVVVALIAIAAVALTVRSIAHTNDITPTTTAGESRPTVVDPSGLGAALSVIYDTGEFRPTVVDPSGLGAALSVIYDTGEFRPTVVDPSGLGAALSVIYDTGEFRPTVVDPSGLGAALSVIYDTGGDE